MKKVIAIQSRNWDITKDHIYNIKEVDKEKGYCDHVVSEKGVSICAVESETYKTYFREYDDKLDFTKNDLKTGYMVKLSNGDMPIVMLGVDTGSKDGSQNNIFAYVKGQHLELDSYKNDLTMKHRTSRNYDVMEVYKPKSNNYIFTSELDKFTMIWKREELREFTIEECAKALGVLVSEFRLKK